MTTTSHSMNQQSSFLSFIWKDKNNQRLLLIAVIASYVQYIVFKICYPFPDFFSDSYSYIYVASRNFGVGIWPIGYSKFLRWLHFISQSDTIVIAMQYALMQLAALYFFFTLNYFFQLKKYGRLIIYVFLVFNPFSLYLSNYINSDALFAALSLCWFTHLIWIIQRPKSSQVITQALLLFLAFTVRNNAYYYPILTALAFFLSTRRTVVKIAGTLAPLVLLVPYIMLTREAAKKMTGTPMYSLFTGWQLANNTLYMYGYVNIDSTHFTSPETRELNRVCARYFKPMGEDFYAYLRQYPANFFIVQPDAPLKQYFDAHYDNSSMRKNTMSWGKVSPTFESFGKTLLKDHPIAFARYFMLINTKNYFIPTLEKLALYNLGEDHVYPLAAAWFGYKSTKITAVSKDAQGYVLLLYPVLFLLSNLYLIGGLFLFFRREKINRQRQQPHKTFILVAAFWLLNFGFSVFATIIIYRYHAFPSVVIFSSSILLYEIITATAHSRSDSPAPAAPGETGANKLLSIENTNL